MKRQSLKVLLKLTRKSFKHEAAKTPPSGIYVTRTDLLKEAVENIQAAINYGPRRSKA